MHYCLAYIYCWRRSFTLPRSKSPHESSATSWPIVLTRLTFSLTGTAAFCLTGTLDFVAFAVVLFLACRSNESKCGHQLETIIGLQNIVTQPISLLQDWACNTILVRASTTHKNHFVDTIPVDSISCCCRRPPCAIRREDDGKM
jgi:hypothetical protein